MRVCHVWDRFWPLEIGGLERYILWLSNYLSRHENIDFSLVTGRTKFLLVTKNIKKYEDTGFLEVYRLGPNPLDVLKGFCIYTFGSTPRFVEKLKFTSLYSEAANSASAKKADLFHIHGIWRDLEYVNLGVDLSRRYRKPLVVTLHGGFVGDPLDGGMPLESAAVKDILENDAAAITTYSKEVYLTLQRLGLEKKSFLVSNFVDTSRLRNPAQPAPHDLTVVYVGRLEPSLNPELVIHAFQQIHQQQPNTKLVIVGYGPQFGYLQNLVRELGLEGVVSLVGKQIDVRGFLWGADVFVASNFGYIACLEAWAAGLAVVAPRFGVLKETVEHEKNGLLFEAGNVEALASALTRVLGDADLRRKLALGGVDAVKAYDIGAVAPKISRIYQSLVKN